MELVPLMGPAQRRDAANATAVRADGGGSPSADGIHQGTNGVPSADRWQPSLPTGPIGGPLETPALPPAHPQDAPRATVAADAGVERSFRPAEPPPERPRRTIHNSLSLALLAANGYDPSPRVIVAESDVPQTSIADLAPQPSPAAPQPPPVAPQPSPAAPQQAVAPAPVAATPPLVSTEPARAPVARDLQAAPRAVVQTAARPAPSTAPVAPARPGFFKRVLKAMRRFQNSLWTVAGKGNDAIRLEPRVDAISALGPKMAAMSDAELQGMTDKFRARIAKGEPLDAILPEAFAVVREAASRVLHMRPFDVQVMGGIAIHEGKIAEMGTGEGKTLTATMPVYLNALSGKGAHVVTVNQTLAERDGENMGKLYRWLGLTVGIVPESFEDLEGKRAAYNADVTYTTNASLGFDYLRDQTAKTPEQRVCREPNFVLIDEVDEILIDEARTPLILSGEGDKSSDDYLRFAGIVKGLKNGDDYEVDYKDRLCWLTDRGIDKVQKDLGIDNLYDEDHAGLVRYVNAALKAQALFQRDKDYMVTPDHKVEIVDEFTGRIMDGRRYSDGIHQALEAKEGVPIQPENKTLASITYPNLFRRYNKLAGMSGTAKTEEKEFQELYGMSVAVIPPNCPSRRMDLRDEIFQTQKEKFDAVVEFVKELHAQGKPVLVPTRTVATNEYLDRRLTQAGIEHRVLSARSVQENTAAENAIIALAGKTGQVTAATNMTGRGTDIQPDLINMQLLTAAIGTALEKGASRVVVLLPNKKPIDDVKLWLTSNNMTVAGDVRTAAEVAAGRPTFEAAAPEQPAQAIAPPQVQIVLNDGTPLSFPAGTACIDASAPELATDGLHVVGTERHESRRIDNQLKGRAARQGQPGVTKFFLSLEDEIMARFAGDSLKDIFKKLGVKNGQGASDPMLDKAIAYAQQTIESMNFDARKNTTKYDSVLNMQRDAFYESRDEVVDGCEIHPQMKDWVEDAFDRTVEFEKFGNKVKHSDAEALWDKLQKGMDLPATCKPAVLSGSGRVHIPTMRKQFVDAVMAHIEMGRKLLGNETWEAEYHRITLDYMDEAWFAHLDNMQGLQNGVGLEAYAQKDPWVAYQLRAYDLWSDMRADCEANIVGHAANLVDIVAKLQEQAQAAKAQAAAVPADGVATPTKAPEAVPADGQTLAESESGAPLIHLGLDAAAMEAAHHLLADGTHPAAPPPQPPPADSARQHALEVQPLDPQAPAPAAGNGTKVV